MHTLRILLFGLFVFAQNASAQTARLKDVYPLKARYSPGEAIQLQVETNGTAQEGELLVAKVTDLGEPVGTCGPLKLTPQSPSSLQMSCSVPATDFRGYLVTVELRSADGRVIGTRETALDISSDWKRYPRYGYLAHYNVKEGANPVEWIAELNRFHMNGLEFYDFQYRHDEPLAGTVKQPTSIWKDIAGREIDANILREFIEQAHAHNMMAMAYNASYSAYDDVFSRPHPLPIQWATWPTADGRRTPQTAKALSFHNAAGWSTSKLFYMNQNDPGWQNYLFGQMHKLFETYKFDGWHIDTFGAKSAFDFEGAPVDYIAGFRPYIDHASEALKKRIVFNAVNTWGQDEIAKSAADFVYSELWEDHETFASILNTAEQVHVANPAKGIVIAAYLHRDEGSDHAHSQAKFFNPPSVLLTDATIFASGAAHIELGDGFRMLSSEYFPADTRLAVSPALRDSLRHYYDFLTAYEVYLRDHLTPAPVAVHIKNYPVDPLGVPNTIWSIAWQQKDMTIVHLINLLGSDDPHWRDISLSRPAPPQLHSLHLQLDVAKRVRSIGWASPDVEGGRFHPLRFERHSTDHGEEIEVNLPELSYWDTLFIRTEGSKQE